VRSRPAGKVPVVELVRCSDVGSHLRPDGTRLRSDAECPLCMEEWLGELLVYERALVTKCGHVVCLQCLALHQKGCAAPFPDGINVTGTAQMTFCCPLCRGDLVGCPDLSKL
jgi:hypothetical protein